MPCNGCGDCCESIIIGPDRIRVIKGAMQKSYDHQFIYSHWHVKGYEGDSAIYWCDQFDQLSRKCLAQDTKPRVCSDYPFYANEPSIEIMLAETKRFPKCGYIAEVLVDIACGG